MATQTSQTLQWDVIQLHTWPVLIKSRSIIFSLLEFSMCFKRSWLEQSFFSWLSWLQLSLCEHLRHPHTQIPRARAPPGSALQAGWTSPRSLCVNMQRLTETMLTPSGFCDVCECACFLTHRGSAVDVLSALLSAMWTEFRGVCMFVCVCVFCQSKGRYRSKTPSEVI